MLGAEAEDKEGGAGGKQSKQEITEAEEKPQAVVEVEEEEEEGQQRPEEAAACWHTGVCKWFNPSKGWGFINVTEIQVESGELSEADKPKVCETESEASTVEKKLDGQEKIEKQDENQLEKGLPGGDIFVHQSTIQKEGFR